jgi:formiminotetrahydrofolate cyclodeaminase
MPETTGTVKKPSGGSGVLGAIGGQVASTIVTMAFAKADAKKQREMEEKLSLLSLAQQKDLEQRLQDIQGELARQEIIYKYLAVQKNDEALAKIKGVKYTSYIVIGVGVIIFSLLVLKLAKK